MTRMAIAARSVRNLRPFSSFQIAPTGAAWLCAGSPSSVYGGANGFYAVKKLVGAKAAHGDRAHQLLKSLLAQAEEDIGKLHAKFNCNVPKNYKN